MYSTSCETARARGKKGATTNFFSGKHNSGVFSNSTTTIPTRPRSAAFPPPDDESKQQHLGLTQSLLLVEVPDAELRTPRDVDYIMCYLAVYEHHGALPVVELGPPEEEEEEC